MKKIYKLLISTVVMIIALTTFALASGMETNRFDVDIAVKEDNVYSVTYKIDVNFTTPKHGIYFYINNKGTVYREIDGKSVESKYRAHIKNVRVRGGEYDESQDGDYKLFKIGDEDITLVGRQSYEIAFDYVLYDDKIDSMDEFYFNIIPHNWETDIKNSHITITMPKDFDQNETYFYVGEYGDSTESKDFSISGNAIIADLYDLDQGVGATCRINLPEGYYVNERTDTLLVTVAHIAPFIFLVIVLLLWLVFGRGKKPIPTVEFYPPKDMTSAELGYIVDGVIDNNDIISLIIYWADKGYLQISTSEDSDDFTLTKLKNLPVSAKNFEKIMFDGLFDNRDSVTKDDLNERFYTTINATSNELTAHFRKTKQKLFTTASQVARVFCCILIGLPLAVFMFIMGYVHISDFATISGIVSIVGITISGILYSYTNQVKYSRSVGSRIGFTVLSAVIFLIPVLFSLIASVEFSGSFFVIILSAITLLVGAISLVMPVRTDENLEPLGKILGLKDFIYHAELDRIKELCNENPEYFYSVLPYAYVLGLSNDWAKRFESIAIEPPHWYVGRNYSTFNTLLFMHSFDRNMNTMRSTMVSAPQSKGGSGFGGGGGFSGGGFGGGGGGSW